MTLKKKDKAGRKNHHDIIGFDEKVCFHLHVPSYNMMILGTRHYCAAVVTVAAAVAAHFVSRFIASFVGSLWRGAQA